MTSEVFIQGIHPSYAGASFAFYTHADPFTMEKQVLGTALADSAGFFSVTIQLDKTSRVNFLAGIYQLYFFAEPGKEYSLRLPERKDKQPEDFLNPYFQPDLIHLDMADELPADLNALIRSFDRAYYPVYNELAVQVYGRRSIPGFDNAIMHLQDGFPDNPEYFSEYKGYRIEQLRLMVRKTGAGTKGTVNFPDKPPSFNNPAYTDLFMQTFSHVLRHLNNYKGADPVNRLIVTGRSPALMMPVIREGLELGNDHLLEVVLLKGLFDAYYADELPAGAVIHMLDSIGLAGKSIKTQRYALSIKQHITRLMPGYPAPGFSLPGMNGKLISLEDLRGRYVYLMFCSAKSYACMRDAQILEPLSKRYLETISVVSVMIDHDMDILVPFMADKPENWIFLTCEGQGNLLEKYRVRAYPTYYLIGPHGELILSPAPGPMDRFEEHFLKAIHQ